MTGQRTWGGVNSLSLPAWELEANDEGTKQEEMELNFSLGCAKIKWGLFMWAANCVWIVLKMLSSAPLTASDPALSIYFLFVQGAR